MGVRRRSGKQQRRGARTRRARVGEDDERGVDTWRDQIKSNFLIFQAAAVLRILFGIKPTWNFMKIFVELGEDKIQLT